MVNIPLSIKNSKGVWICREVRKHEKPGEPHALHTIAQAPAWPQLLRKTLEGESLQNK